MIQPWKIYRLVARETPTPPSEWKNYVVTTNRRRRFHLAYHPGEGRFCQSDDMARFCQRPEAAEVLDAIRWDVEHGEAYATVPLAFLAGLLNQIRAARTGENESHHLCDNLLRTGTARARKRRREKRTEQYPMGV